MYQLSHLSQKLKVARVPALIQQVNALRALKRYGTLTNFVCPKMDNCNEVVLVHLPMQTTLIRRLSFVILSESCLESFKKVL